MNAVCFIYFRQCCWRVMNIYIIYENVVNYLYMRMPPYLLSVGRSEIVYTRTLLRRFIIRTGSADSHQVAAHYLLFCPVYVIRIWRSREKLPRLRIIKLYTNNYWCYYTFTRHSKLCLKIFYFIVCLLLILLTYIKNQQL